ncbi:MAG: ATP-binding cassette domain-containing protein [Calditrichaeota bacterium]|nr:MAG: ATP-binding cassette domain-containing protein [Calditrichota bacterium]MBL1205390.1 ATP-binding cassette domain-containing protein [Calditrichota bacterium]NOG45219.1 ATP-binding cassette domain-containing protein [Calditrichota bacterium]
MAEKTKAPPPNKLEVKNVSKSFSDQVIIHGLSFCVNGGETFGLLGPNGAGKTTMMRIIMNIIKPDLGEVLFNGEPRDSLKALHFGYLPEERGLYPRASVLDVLVYFGTLNNLSKRKAEVEAIRYLDRLGLIDFADRPVNQLSKGMQQKVQFIAAFLHDPDVLILDEPFSGLDPINQIVLRDILIEYKQKKKILIISTHQMELAEKLCDHICLINNGNVVIDGDLKKIKRTRREDAYLIEADELNFLHDLDEVEVLEENNSAFKIKMVNKKSSVQDLLNKINKRSSIRRFEIVEPSLHDIFIKIIQDSEHS